MIAAVSTHYGPLKLRSRTEARWAVFLDAAGIRYQYEFEGYSLRDGYYLPDFWLPDLSVFLEIKGVEPTEAEVAKCAQLADLVECTTLLAVGPPEEKATLRLFAPGMGEAPDRYVFARDRFTEWGFWLVALPDDTKTLWIGPTTTMSGWRGGPMLSGALEAAYGAAASARFERGDGKRRLQPIVETDPARHVETGAAA